MWKVVSGLHRASLGGFRTSLREDGQPYGQGHRLFNTLNLNSGLPFLVPESNSSSLRCNFKPLSTAVSQNSTSQASTTVQQCGLLQQLLSVPTADRGQQQLLAAEVLSTAVGSPYSRRFHDKGYDEFAGERRDGWNLVDVFNGSTALVLSYNLIHQQRENSVLSAYCGWKSFKQTKAASAQPVEERNQSTLSSLSSLQEYPGPGTQPSSLLESLDENPTKNLLNNEHITKHNFEALESLDTVPPVSKSPQNQEEAYGDVGGVVEVGSEFRLELDSIQGIQLLEAGHPAGVRYLKEQSRRGSSISSFYLGMAYEQGHLVSRNLVTACKYYQQASKLGNPEAMYNLAVFYQSGLGGLVKDEGRASRLLKKAAEAGVPAAREVLGYPIHQEEVDVERSGRDLYLLGQSFESLGETEVALDMYTRALKAGYARARRAKQRLDSLSNESSA